MSETLEKLKNFEITREQNNDPLYGTQKTSFNPNEKVRIIVEVEVDKQAKALPQAQVDKVKKAITEKEVLQQR